MAAKVRGEARSKPDEGSLLRRKGPFRRAVIAWYRAHNRELSWRGVADPYIVWVSEVALQQTRVEQGTPYIERFLEAFPSVEALADAHEDSVLKLWEGLGYYNRARNLHRAAREIVSEYNGVLPKTATEWETLPGVGRYTAGAIASIAYDEPVSLLDGNVKRVLARLIDLDASIDTAETTRYLWGVMDRLVVGKSPGDFNQGMMELGAQVCTPRSPNCAECPVARYCGANRAGTQALRPVRTKRAETPHYEIVVGAIKRNGRYLIGKRPPNGLLGGLWEFPGGKVKPGESHDAALRRELLEELKVRADVGGLIACVKHAYSHFRVTLNVYRCEIGKGRPRPRTHTALKWVRHSEFDAYAFPKANHKFLDLL